MNYDDRNFLQGKSFFYYYSANAVPENTTINISLTTGLKNITIDKIELLGTSELLTWNWFVDSKIDEQSGTILDYIPLNSLVQKDPDTTLRIDPTIISDGTRIIDGDIDSMGMQATEGRTRLYEEILSNRFAVSSGTTQIIRIKNRSPTGQNRNIEVKILISIM